MRAVREFLATRPYAVNTIDANGYTALHHAVALGNLAITRVLLQSGADVHALGPENWTPMHLVRVHDVAEELIARGANINSRNAAGDTPLHVFLQTTDWHHDSKFSALIETTIDRADLNIPNGAGATPFHLVVSYFSPPFRWAHVRPLLHCLRLNPDVRVGMNGTTEEPFHLALTQILNYLEATTHSALDSDRLAQFNALLASFLRLGADPNALIDNVPGAVAAARLAGAEPHLRPFGPSPATCSPARTRASPMRTATRRCTTSWRPRGRRPRRRQAARTGLS